MIDIVISVVVLLLAAGLRFLYVHFKASEIVKQATEAVILAVQAVQVEYTEAIKKGREDGKLTAEEAATAKSMAIEKAKLIAKGEGLSLLKSWGSDKLSGLIELALEKIRSKV